MSTGMAQGFTAVAALPHMADMSPHHDEVLCSDDLIGHIVEMLDSSSLLLAIDVNRHWRTLIRNCKFLWENTRLNSTSTDLEGLRTLYHSRQNGMTSLDASRCRRLSDTWLTVFSAETMSTRNLLHLNLSSCNKLDIDSLCEQWGGILSLKSLNLDWCHQVSNKTVNSICDQANAAGKPTSLTKLSMRGCPVGDAGITLLCQYAPSLESIDIALVPYIRLKRLTKVSDEFLLSLASLPCPNLEEINVAGHADITDFGVTALVYRLPTLKRFDVACCAAVTQSCMEGVAAICQGVVFNTTLADCDAAAMSTTSSSSDSMSDDEMDTTY